MCDLNKFILFLICLFMATPAISQQPLVPFVQFEIIRPDWDTDPSEVAYVGARCYSLYTATAGFFLGNSGTPEDTRIGKGLYLSSIFFIAASEKFSYKRGMSKESFDSRNTALVKNYAGKLLENRRLHNNVLHEPIAGDMKFCKKNEDFYTELAKP